VEGIQKVKAEIEQFKFEAEQAERNGDYGKVAELRYGRIKEGEIRLKEFEGQLAIMQKRRITTHQRGSGC
jgi:ATP-dependent Clp protease ATP-binding subunit ClpB